MPPIVFKSQIAVQQEVRFSLRRLISKFSNTFKTK